jgi:hypothetical protein
MSEKNRLIVGWVSLAFVVVTLSIGFLWAISQPSTQNLQASLEREVQNVQAD